MPPQALSPSVDEPDYLAAQQPRLHAETVPDKKKDPLQPDHHDLNATLQFDATLAHEIRNPLTNINLSVALLGTVITDKTHKSYLDIIARSSVRINNLINELLTNRKLDPVKAEIH